LPIVARNGEDDRRARASGRRDHDPPFAAVEGRVLDDGEGERVAKKREPGVVARDQKGEGADALGHRRLSWRVM